jgi:hypothetical protein
MVAWSERDPNRQTLFVVESSGGYEYPAVAYDEDNSKTCTDDPAMIVAGGGLDDPEDCFCDRRSRLHRRRIVKPKAAFSRRLSTIASM